MEPNPRLLVRKIAEIGSKNNSKPELARIEIFQSYFTPKGDLDISSLNNRDGNCTRREILTRFLLLSAVIDQGPDIVGIRNLLIEVTNSLYRREIRFLHRPLNFFKEIGVSIDTILEKNQSISALRAAIWARENKSNPTRYNLFMDNSRQVLNYAIFRWGVPLALPLLLENDHYGKDETQPLLNYIESWNSAEAMCQQVKDHNRYGLGKAIGDKASHLFAKWFVSSFGISRLNHKSWGPLSFEVPYDSNAGRVLWRTGYLSLFASIQFYTKNLVIQKGRGKGGLDYIRVTNIRGLKSNIDLPKDIMESYADISVNYLKSHKKSPKKVEIQRIQHAYLLADYENTNLSVSDFDEGLIYIGTNFCFNHSEPNCKKCPLMEYCVGHEEKPELINKYRT